MMACSWVEQKLDSQPNFPESSFVQCQGNLRSFFYFFIVKASSLIDCKKIIFVLSLGDWLNFKCMFILHATESLHWFTEVDDNNAVGASMCGEWFRKFQKELSGKPSQFSPSNIPCLTSWILKKIFGFIKSKPESLFYGIPNLSERWHKLKKKRLNCMVIDNII